MAVLGYIMNLYWLFKGPDWTSLIRVLGLLIFPLGAILGFIPNAGKTQG